ncbi:MAG: hypothetical protein CL526_12615 [Aequorivita sp.]|nr:hypothetical protein [Aequorivita sp.]
MYNSVRLIAPKNEHQINTMNYEKKKAADRLQAYYLKKTEYYADLPVTERARPDQFARVWRNFKSHIKEAYTPKP